MDNNNKNDNKKINSSNAVKGIIENKGKFLIIKRESKDSERPSSWEFPGGRLNKGEDPRSGLKREIFEETNLKVDIINPINIRHYTRNDGQVITMMIYYCQTNDKNANKVKISHEHDDFLWLSLEELKDIILPFFLEDIKIFEKLKACDFFLD